MPHFRLALEEEFLLLCCSASQMPRLRERTAELIERGLSWDRVLGRIQRYPFPKVASLGLRNFKTLQTWLGLRSDITSYAQESYDINIRRNTEWLKELRRIANALDGLEWIVLKGPALMCGFYQDLGLRRFFDVDLLISRGDIASAEERLKRLGYASSPENERNREFYVTVHHHWPPLECDAEGIRFFLDLHTSASKMLPSASLNERILKSRRVVEFAETRIPIPGADYLFLQGLLDVVMHLPIFAGMKKLFDLDRLAQSGALKWSAISEEAHRMGYAAELELVISLLRDITRTPLPPDAEAAVKFTGAVPRRVRKSSQAVLLFRPSDRLLTWRLLAPSSWRSHAQFLRAFPGPRSAHMGEVPPGRRFRGLPLRVYRQLARLCRSFPDSRQIVRTERAIGVLESWLANAQEERQQQGLVSAPPASGAAGAI